MKKTREQAKRVSAEEIASMAEANKDVSKFFTCKKELRNPKREVHMPSR
jgi:hypothetical protein